MYILKRPNQCLINYNIVLTLSHTVLKNFKGGIFHYIVLYQQYNYSQHFLFMVTKVTQAWPIT